ncbi:DUF5703 family protein [Pengzhenrongella frigida]|uniref:Dihydroorotate dehydrogenase n=1 Tax=Pengzhenrongella frigida TaxID=1259133 RepID=A0A4Q5N3E2_9MICO|nr:DUF5703 family protein [Cellulomonas sp. HLT2-17]RYV52666.1 hypothetical protein EUA98_01595 [Cellulomonas sp. HLT2-17]
MNKGVTGRAADDWAAQGGEYEYRMVRLPPSTSRGEARRMLTEEAEYGRWELARTRLFPGGARKVWLRRKAIRVRSTLDIRLLDDAFE